ncbi:MAG: hypothetical protein HY584_03300 [Candidatus Omnitrophica bacterium]|nr:hypothetical protein [Candidatus Omnitrophota bacterium]
MKFLSRKKFFTTFLLIAFISFSDAMYAFAFSIPKPISGESQSIPIVGSCVKIKGLTNQTNQCFINGREVFIAPDGSFYEEILIPLGETEIKVEVRNKEGLSKTITKMIRAKANYFSMAGIADGTLNWADSNDRFKLMHVSKSVRDRFNAAGKISYYMFGKLHGKYMFKSAVDTDKATQEKLFTYIDPDLYYPIYGDNSTVVYDVNSQGKIYALVEWDKSGATWGNYQTLIGEENENKLIRYNRTLYGGKVHVETPKRTIYGDPVTKATAYFAEANQRAGHSELLATGGSLYYFRHRNIVEGSEQVRLEVRDKNSGIPIYSTPQEQIRDYEIKYDEGRIMFHKPLLSIAPSDTVISDSVLGGNPVYVVANYEYKNQEAFPISLDDLDNRTAGFRVSQHFRDHIRGALTYLQEEQDGKYYKLLGGDSTVKLGNFTRLDAEIAHSTADSISSYISYGGGYDYEGLTGENLQDGTALRIEANSSLGEYMGKDNDFLNFSGYWQRVDRNYSAVDSMFEAGSEKYGLNFSHRVTKNDEVRVIFEQQDIEKGATNDLVEDQIQAKRSQIFTGQWSHDWDKFHFITEYQMRNEREPLGPLIDNGKGRVKGHLVGERIQYDISDRTSVHLAQQVGLTDINDSLSTVGFSRKVSDKTTVSAQAGVGPMGHSVLASIQKNMDAHNSSYSNYLLSNSAVDGRTSTTSFGSNTKISETATLRRERQVVSSETRGVFKSNVIGYENQITPELKFDFDYQKREEKQDPFTITSPEATNAASGFVSYLVPDKIKAYSKAEHRFNSDEVWQLVLDSQGEFKATKDFFVFAEHEYSTAKDNASQIDKKQVGIAFRPVNFDWFNALAKYIRFADDRPENVTSADGGFVKMQSQSDTFAGEYALDLPVRFQFVQKIAFQDEEIMAANTTNTIQTPENLKALLMIYRLNYHLTNRIDFAAEYRRLRRKGSDIRDKEHGALVEITFQIIKHVAIGCGFNFTNITEDITDHDSKNAKGFFIRMQGKY